MMRRIRVLWNPKSGSGSTAADVRALLDGRREIEVVEPDSSEDSEAWAARATDEDFDLLVAAGGDGTFNSVASGVLRGSRSVPVALLPLGRANDLARTLCIPADAEEAIALWGHARVMRMDAVRVELDGAKSWSFNVVTGGNGARVQRDLTEDTKQRWGAWSYFRGAIEILPDLMTYRVSGRVDDRVSEPVDAVNFVLANGKYAGGGIALAPDADPQDGKLDFVVIRDGPPLDVGAMTAQLLMGNYLDNDLVEFHRASKVRLSLDPASPLSIDGELVEAREATFSIVPGAIEVVVGAEYAAGAGE